MVGRGGGDSGKGEEGKEGGLGGGEQERRGEQERGEWRMRVWGGGVVGAEGGARFGDKERGIGWCAEEWRGEGEARV